MNQQNDAPSGRLMAEQTAWANLINGLGILQAGAYQGLSPVLCEGDKLTIQSDPGRFRQRDLDMLARMGFIADQRNYTFYFRWFDKI